MSTINTNSQQAIPTEALSLSASIFFNSIDSWIPSNFGESSKSSSSTILNSKKDDSDFNNLLIKPNFINNGIPGQPSSSISNDRLGLGHPSLDSPIPSQQRNGLIGLSKKLNLERKGKAKEEFNAFSTHNEDDQDEEESKGRGSSKSSSSQKKHKSIDPFSTAKKNKKKDPFAIGNNKVHPAVAAGMNNRLNLEDDIPLQNDTSGGEEEEDGPPFPPFPPSISRQTTPINTLAASSPSGSGVFPYDGPRPFGSPSKSKKSGKRPLNDNDDEGENEDEENDTEGKDQHREQRTEGDQSDQTVINEDNNDKEVLQGPTSVKSKTQLRREKRKRAKLSKS
ncbi:uncharacterized protein L201_004667 [Kwoniella dendrophila CBS 6074]|uniref:Uncharacterized protein n=1 Tax=Kwoniella dendrophila CBS 6074 TaxID=1295534 RepID=A0AAX4JYD9_9TREE